MKTNTTRVRILEAGLKAFSDKGYLGATTKEIAGKASVAEPTLFRHFSSKEKLFEEVINTYSFLPALKGILREIEDLKYADALTLIAGRFLETLIQRKDLIRIMHSEMQRYPEQIQRIHHAIVDELFKVLASYFDRLKEKGIIIDMDTRIAARAFLGMFFSYFYARELKMLKKFMEDDTEKTIEEYVKLFVRGTIKRK